MRIKLFQTFIDILRGKKAFPLFESLYEKYQNSKIGNHYTIIPIGTFCLPRISTTICNLKRRKKFGEKSYPFDLAFFSDLTKTTELIKNNFDDFYTDVETENGCYVNKKYSAMFNHDGMLTQKEFKERYDKRIKNFYNALADNSKLIYFVYADDKELSQEKIDDFISAIRQFRKDNFKIIIIYNNCRYENKLKNVDKVIDDIDIWSLNQNGEWNLRLCARKRSKQADKVYKKLKSKLHEAIK